MDLVFDVRTSEAVAAAEGNKRGIDFTTRLINIEFKGQANGPVVNGIIHICSTTTETNMSSTPN